MFIGKNVFVTGAAGFIGSAMVRSLVSQGANVCSLVRAGHASNVELLKGSKIYTGDICDYSLVSEIISTNEIEYVCHLAANAIVKNSARDPLNAYRVNVMGTVTVLDAAKSVGRCKKILVASSDKAYGDHTVLPYTEDMPILTKNTYDTSKACADLIARTYAHNYDMPVVVTRCSNVYGPGDPNLSRIIPNTITRILRGEAPMLYSDVSDMEREFIYIGDVVRACTMLLESDSTTNGQAYNVGGGGPISITELIESIKRIMGTDVATVIVQREPVFKEIVRQYIDASKIFSAVGWNPEVSLDEGLTRTVRQIRESSW